MRTHQRLELSEPLDFESLTIDPPGEQLSRKGVCRNLSLTGIYFETDTSLEIMTQFKIGNIVWVRVKVPNTQEILKVQCEIRRVINISKKTVGLGAMFINLSQRAEKAIVSFVR